MPRLPLSSSLVGTRALARENVGHVVTREMRVDGDTLTIALDTTSGAEPVTRTLVWTRVA